MLFKNSVAQSASLVTGYAFSLLLAPIMLSRLGLTQFGVWAVTGAMATYAGLADFGITRSLARFIALYDAKGDVRAIKECLGLGLLTITAIGIVAGLVALVIAPDLAGSLGVAPSELRILLLCSVLIFVFQAYRRVLNSLETGLQRMVPPNVANVVTNVLNFGFSVAALLIHPTLQVYAMANAASYLLGIGTSLASVLYVWRSVPLAIPSRSRAREIVSFGFKSQLHFLADLVNLQTDKMIIAFFVGVRAAATYEIAARVVVAVRAVGLLTISAMIPTLTAHITRFGRATIDGFYRRYTRLSVGLAFPVFFLACIGAPFLLVAWLGDVPGEGALVLVSLTLAYLVNVSTEVGMNVATADGNPGIVAWNSILTAALNLAATALLAPIFGFWGVLVGTVLAVSAGSLLFVRGYHRLYESPLRDYFDAVLPPLALAGGLAVPFVVWDLVHGAPSARGEALLTLVSITVAYAGPYWVLASRFGFLPSRLSLPVARRRTQSSLASPGSR